MGAKLFYSCKNGFHCFRVCYRISVPYPWITLDVCVDLVSSNRDKLISIVSLIPSTMLNPLQGSSKPDSMELLSKFCKVLFKPLISAHLHNVMNWTWSNTVGQSLETRKWPQNQSTECTENFSCIQKTSIFVNLKLFFFRYNWNL